MSRKRLIKEEELSRRNMKCKCGRSVEVLDARVISVTCCFCSIGMKPIPDGYLDDLNEYIEQEKEEAKKRKVSQKGKAELKKEKVMSKMISSNATKSQNKGKRGRKANVGAKVFNFIKEKESNVKFEEILNVYSSERERLGKKSSPDIEKRNCLSTLYIMKRNNKIQEVEPKSVYCLKKS